MSLAGESPVLGRGAARAAREMRAVNAALNATHAARIPGGHSWAQYLEWLEVSVDSAMRHAVGT